MKLGSGGASLNLSTWEAEARGSVSSRPAWSTKQVPEQSGLSHRETLSQKAKNQTTTTKINEAS